MDTHLCRRVLGGSHEGWGHTWSSCPPVLARPPVLQATQRFSGGRFFPSGNLARMGGSFKSDFRRRVTQA